MEGNVGVSLGTMLGRAVGYMKSFWSRKGPRSRADKIVFWGFAVLMLVAIPALALVPDVPDDPFDEDRGITYVNSTDQLLHVYTDGYFQTSLVPGESYTDGYFYWRDDARLIEAVDREGRVVFTEVLTHDEFEGRGGLVAIESPDLLNP